MLTFSPFADRKNISFNLNSAVDEIVVYVSKEKFDKILTNIFSNAFKFTPEFGKIDVSVSEKNNFVVISISDTGIGISKEKTNRIFDRFYQADSSSTREQEGTGIGLSLAKELVELHKGKIEVESEEGKGTTFNILFRTGKEHLFEDQIVEKTVEPEITEEFLSADLNDARNFDNDDLENIINTSEKPRLLIVEDNLEVRRFIKENMSKDHLINEATDGLAGIDKAFELIPDLIISDVMMPKMDGYKLCETLKSDARTSHIPIILLTAKAETGDRITGLETGADDYIIKPFEMNELRVRIKNLIEQRKRMHNHLKTIGIVELEASSITSVDKKFLQKVYELINTNLSNSNFNVEALSQNIGMSRAVLHKKLVSLIGEPPVELIRRIRLIKSAELITKKFGNLSEIALEVGFNNPAYFSECFKKQFGVSPSQYASKSNKN
jgi:DNA-binding response OmpR family regulator/anti-sigma regulatory factor (Ser/Thr protein kinase)